MSFMQQVLRCKSVCQKRLKQEELVAEVLQELTASLFEGLTRLFENICNPM